ncbi:nuclear transport factor 2 family protein [Maricaulis sp.]|uniref:nuclear transport factor 2 family protein n=1 Tax=Maricaulis sp. TaxID=1486257 RepID=UPI00260F8C64|nr:nuclear transport factor 2 family protein [Maricaulis sp.]
MRPVLLTSATLALTLLSTPPTLADDDPVALAQAYIHAYEAQDFDAMLDFMADEMVFIDPTSFDLVHVSEAANWTGPDAIISGISAWNIHSGDYRIERIYEAAGRVIFDGAFDARMATPDGFRTFRYPIVTIITIEDGQVIEHRDYTGLNDVIEVTAASEDLELPSGTP